MKKLAKVGEKITVEIYKLTDNISEEIKGLKHVINVAYDSNLMVVSYDGGKNNIADMIDFLRNNEISYNKIYSERPTLNDVFLELTGKELRD